MAKKPSADMTATTTGNTTTTAPISGPDPVADQKEGALIVVGPQVFFIPRADLRTYRVPEEMARTTLESLRQRAILRGHPNDGAVFGAELSEDGSALGMSSIYEHALTVSRFH